MSSSGQPHDSATPAGDGASASRRRGGAASRVAIAVVAVLLVLGAAGVAAVRHWSPPWAGATTIHGGGGSGSATASPSSADPHSDLTALLEHRADALRQHDRAAWLATVDPADDELRQSQAALFDRLQNVPFSTVAFRYSAAGPALSQAQQTALGPTAWIAKVVFAYTFTGVSDTEIRREQYLTLAPRDGHWYVAGTGDGAAGDVQRDLWDLGPVYLYEGARSLVISSSPEDLDDWAAKVDAAAAKVDSVWGTGWPRRVVVVVPATQSEMARLLGRPDETGLNQIAAVTTGEVTTTVGQSSDRVILNPAGFRRLHEVGGRIVLTHEVTHVATRSAGPGEVPIWFSEGFADYVAYTTNPDVSVQEAVSGYLAQFAGNDEQPQLPTVDSFNAGSGHDLTPAYSAAYLAVDWISEVYGRAALLELYHVQAGDAGPHGSASTPVPLERAMPAILDGLTVQQFTQRWAAWVREKAAASSTVSAAPGANATG